MPEARKEIELARIPDSVPIKYGLDAGRAMQHSKAARGSGRKEVALKFANCRQEFVGECAAD